MNPKVKKFLKSANIWQSYARKISLFFESLCSKFSSKNTCQLNYITAHLQWVSNNFYLFLNIVFLYCSSNSLSVFCCVIVNTFSEITTILIPDSAISCRFLDELGGMHTEWMKWMKMNILRVLLVYVLNGGWRFYDRRAGNIRLRYDSNLIANLQPKWSALLGLMITGNRLVSCISRRLTTVHRPAFTGRYYMVVMC